MALDLLIEPLISWRDSHRRRGRTTLPGALARLASGELADFSRLRTHQLHPWCMFLTQLAAIALRKDGRTDARLSEDEWRGLLLQLTNQQNEPWSLVIEDLSKPAFFQPPVPEGSTTKWNTCDYPDDVDVLITSKDHDVKSRRMHGDEPETWAYAFVTLQTTQGYPGRGYNRIARMKGGYGNRPRVGVTSDHTLTARFLRDVNVLLDFWDALVERGYHDAGVALCWIEPWDGRTSLGMDALAPHFIEVCWRVRCILNGGHVRCLYTTTQARRCVPEIESGDVGDPWIPIERSDGSALTVGRSGFNYRLITELMFERDYAGAAAQAIRTDDRGGLLFVASALARGQGRTEGLHERTIYLNGKVRPRIGHQESRAALGERAAQRVVAAGTMRTKVLFPALKQLALDGTPLSDQFDALVDDMFFDHLFGTLDLPDAEARSLFEHALCEVAKAELERAIERTSSSNARRFKAISDAERMFHMCLRKSFPDISGATNRTDEGRA